MFSFCKDYVAEEAKVAPLVERLTSSFGKNPISSDSDSGEPTSKRKKREARSQCQKSTKDVDGVSKGKNMDASTKDAAGSGQLLTTCYLCDLHFTTEVELEEHLYSLLHHRALDTEKGKSFTHECNLCRVRCAGLPAYVCHLRSDEHRHRTEVRKRDIESNPKSVRVFGLFRYKDTFMCRPTSAAPRIALSETTKNLSSQSVLTRNVQNLSQKKTPELPPRSNKPFFFNHSPPPPMLHHPFIAAAAGQLPHFNRGFGHRPDRTYAMDPRWPHPMRYPPPRPFYEDPVRFDDWFCRGYPDDLLRYQAAASPNVTESPSKEWMKANTCQSSNFNESFDRRKRPFLKNETDSNASKDGAGHKKLMAKSNQALLRLSDLGSIDKPEKSKPTGKTNCNEADKNVSSSFSGKPSMPGCKSDDIRNNAAPRPGPGSRPTPCRLDLQRPLSPKRILFGAQAPDTRPDDKEEPFGDKLTRKTSITSDPFAFKEKERKKDGGLFGNAAFTRHSGPTAPPSKAHMSDVSRTDQVLKKFRAVIDEVKTPQTAPGKAPPLQKRKSDSTVSHNLTALQQSLGADRPRSAAFGENRKCSDASSDNQLSSSVRSCESEIVGDPQAFDSSVNTETVEVNLPWPFRLVSPRNHATEAEGSGSSRPEHGLHKPANSSQTGASSNSGDLVCLNKEDGGGSAGVENPSKIRSELNKLARQKRQKQLNKQSRTGDKSDKQASKATADRQSSNEKSSVEDEMNGCGGGGGGGGGGEMSATEAAKKKATPQPNLMKARRTRAANAEKTSSESDCDVRKQQTRTANLLMKLGSKLSLSSDDANQSAKRKLHGPRFGMGLTPQDADAPSATSLDETDILKIISTISMAEESMEKSSCHSSQGPGRRGFAEGEGEKDPSSAASAHSERAVSDSNETKQPEASGDISQRLLQMSEREEALHKHADDTKLKIKSCGGDILRIDQVVEKLLCRKRSLESQLTEAQKRDCEIAKELEQIRGDRLAMLRGSIGNNTSSEHYHSADGLSFNTSNCTHSTPTPKSNPTLTPTPARPTGAASLSADSPQLESDVRNRSGRHARRNSLQRSEVKPEKANHVTTENEPFPVASNSSYFNSTFDPNNGSERSRPKPGRTETSVDDIMQKYLKDARNDGEVTSSTNVKLVKMEDPTDASLSSDFEVSSTTNVENDFRCAAAADVKPVIPPLPEQKANRRGAPSRGKTKKKKSKDSRLASLDKEQPNASDATWSWVTAHSGVSSNSDDRLPSSCPDLTISEALDRYSSVQEPHDGAIVCMEVVGQRLIVSCSKDSTVRVGDVETGQTIGVYILQQTPVAAHVIRSACYDTSSVDASQSFSIQLFVVCDHERPEKPVFSHSRVSKIEIPFRISGPDITANRDWKLSKLFEYFSPILCVHQSSSGHLYLGTKNGRVLVFDCTKAQLVETLDCHSPHAIHCLATGLDGARPILCSGASDCRVSVRDAQDGLLLKMFKGHTKTVNAVQLKGCFLYSASSDRTVLVHNVRSGEVIHRFLGMHGGIVRSLIVCDAAIVTICQDKCVRVLQPEPCRVSGPLKPTSSFPFALCLHHVTCWKDGIGAILPIACVGCTDGKMQLVPLTQLVKKDDNITKPAKLHDDQTADHDVIDDVGELFKCLWNGCDAAGFTSTSALSTHIGVFHAPDDYPEQLDSCCLWDNCTHYFSSEIDTAEDVRKHMEEHVEQSLLRNEV